MLFMLMDVTTQCEDYGLEGLGDDLPDYELNLDTQGMKMGAANAEAALLSGDPEEVLQQMSTDSQAFYDDQIRQISATKLEAMGEAFKSRDLTVSSSTYAEFEFEDGGLVYSTAFGLQADGTWKIIRL